MTTYERITQTRRLVRIGVVLGYAAAVVLMAIRIFNTDPITVGETLGSVALGAALAAPATLALLSLDRRPTLLPAAAIGALALSIVAIWLLPVWLGMAYLWYRAWVGRPVRADVSQMRGAGRVGLGFLIVAAILVLFVHLDPVCTQRLTDGTARSVDASSRGLDTGWVFSSGNRTSSSTSVAGEGVAEETCSSDTIVVAEALASLAITGLVFEAGRRWPYGVHPVAESTSATAAGRAAAQ